MAALSPDERRAVVLKQHDRERANVGHQIRERISAEVDQIREDHAGALVPARHRFIQECADVRGRQDRARAALRQRWCQHNVERRAAFQKARVQVQRAQRDYGQ